MDPRAAPAPSKNIITSITSMVKTRKAMASFASITAIIAGLAVVITSSAASIKISQSGLVSKSSDLATARSNANASIVIGAIVLGGGMLIGIGLIFKEPRVRTMFKMSPF